jgi:hypothetical protein
MCNDSMRKTPLKRKTRLKPRSDKRAAYMRSDERKDWLAHMARVKMLPCIACGAPPPSQAHHVTGDKQPRNDFRVIPLCYACHQGPEGYHAAKRSWVEKHGPDYMLLDRVADMLSRNDV